MVQHHFLENTTETLDPRFDARLVGGQTEAMYIHPGVPITDHGPAIYHPTTSLHASPLRIQVSKMTSGTEPTYKKVR